MIAWAAIVLTVGRGAAPGEVSLEWQGEPGPFAVARAASASLVDDPGAHLANTLDAWVTDAAPPSIVFYRVTPATCGNGTVQLGEECDDGDHVNGDGCTARCMREGTSGCVTMPPPFPGGTGTLWDDAVLFWRLDESGDVARTDAVTGHEVYSDPSTEGTVPVSAKAGGLGQHLDGPNRFHFWCPTASILNHSGQSFTWVAWARLDSTYDDQAILGKWSIPEQQREYLVRFNKTTGVFELEVSANGLAAPCDIGHVAHPTVVETGRFYFVEAWHDAENDRIGLRVSTEALRGPAVDAPWVSGVHFGWGDLNLGSHNTCLDDHFHGTLDAIGFWKRTLTDAESTTLWNGGFGLEIPSSMHSASRSTALQVPQSLPRCHPTPKTTGAAPPSRR